jgi:hypothetical protein
MRLRESRGFCEITFLLGCFAEKLSREAFVCIHGMRVHFAWRCFAVKPQRPKGCALRARA